MGSGSVNAAHRPLVSRTASKVVTAAPAQRTQRVDEPGRNVGPTTGGRSHRVIVSDVVCICNS
jgi:hypothetical protein